MVLGFVFVAMLVLASIMFAFLPPPRQPVIVHIRIDEFAVRSGFQIPAPHPAGGGIEAQYQEGVSAARGNLLAGSHRWLHCGCRQVATGLAPICVQPHELQHQGAAALELQRGEDQVRAGEGQNQGQEQRQNVGGVALVHTQKVTLIQHFHLSADRKWKWKHLQN